MDRTSSWSTDCCWPLKNIKNKTAERKEYNRHSGIRRRGRERKKKKRTSPVILDGATGIICRKMPPIEQGTELEVADWFVVATGGSGGGGLTWGRTREASR